MSNEIKHEFRIRNMPLNLYNDLKAIAKNKGFTNMSTFLRIELRKVRDSYPDKYKEMPKD